MDALKELLRPELAELSSYVPQAPPGIDVHLDANEAPPAQSPAIAEAVARAVAALPLERYPDARALALKAQIAARTGAREDELLVGTGSDDVIALILNALARPRGKAKQPVVLAPTPTFVMYRITARAHGWKSVDVPLDSHWDLDVGAMKRAIEMVPPNVVFIASPNNPTGNAMAASRIVEVVEAAAASNAFVVLDEAYVDYAPATARHLRETYSHVGILRTLSKIGLAALRVGWLEADAALIHELDKGRQPFNVSATSQAAATAVLRDAWDAVRRGVESVISERARVAVEMAGMQGLVVTPSDANFLWVKTARPAAEAHAALVARGILVRSFHAAGGRLASQLRITIGTAAQNDRLLEALRACVA